MVTELERFQEVIKKTEEKEKREEESKEELKIQREREKEGAELTKGVISTADISLKTVKAVKTGGRLLKEEYKKRPKITKRGKAIQSKVRELTKKTYAKLYKKPKVSKTQLDLARERTKQMQLQRRFEVEQLAAQQRAFYEQGEVPMQPQQIHQEQMIEEQPVDNYGRPMGQQSRPRRGFGEAWRKWNDGQKLRQAGMRPGLSKAERVRIDLLSAQNPELINLAARDEVILARAPVNLANPRGIVYEAPTNLLNPNGIVSKPVTNLLNPNGIVSKPVTNLLNPHGTISKVSTNLLKTSSGGKNIKKIKLKVPNKVNWYGNI